MPMTIQDEYKHARRFGHDEAHRVWRERRAALPTVGVADHAYSECSLTRNELIAAMTPKLGAYPAACWNELVRAAREDYARWWHSLVERAQKKVVDEPLTLDDVRFSKALSKSLREYGPDAAEPHVRVAQILKERDVVVGKGSRIEYVVVDASATPQMVIPATDFAGDCDRFWLWERVYSPTLALLEAAFPDDDWSRFEVARPPKAREKKTNENQLGLAIDLPKPKPPKGGAKKLDDDDELAAPVYRSDALVVRIPESAGKDAPERVAEVFKAHPGARRVRVVLVSNGGSEAVLPTVGYVTPGEAFKKAVAEALRPPPSAPLSPT